MKINSESIERITNELRESFKKSFAQEGEFALVTLNLRSTKEEIIETIGKNKHEKKYLIKNYEYILNTIKEELRNLQKMFIEETDKIKEKEDLVSKIKKICRGYNYYYKHNKNKSHEFKSELTRFKKNIDDIKDVISTEFSLEVLIEVYKQIEENYKRCDLLVKIIKKLNYYSKEIKKKSRDIKKFGINKEDCFTINKLLEDYSEFTSNIEITQQTSNEKLDDILMKIEKLGYQLTSTIDKVVEIQKNQISEETITNAENKKLYKSMRRIIVLFGLFGSKK